MRVSLVIPNYNGLELLEKNLPKVISAAPNAQIIIVDDASTDGSVDFIKSQYPKINCIEKVTNNGFATTVNLGFKAADSEIVVVLNTDVVPRKDFLEPLLTHFKEKEVFAVGCLDESSENGKIIKRGRGLGKFFQGFLVHSAGTPNKPNTLWVGGGSSAFSRDLWEKLGGLDDLYEPFYWEDIDISYRAAKYGYRIVFESRSVVLHEHEIGSIKKQFTPRNIEKITYRNQFLFVWKNITDTTLLLNHLIWLPVHLMHSLITDKLMFRAFLDALIKLPGALRGRYRQNQFIKSDKEVIGSAHA